MPAYKNEGDGVLTLHFGTGDIILANAVDHADELLFFDAGGPNPVGALTLPKEGATTANQPTILRMVFGSIASLDVLVSSLQAIKLQMQDAADSGDEEGD